MPLDKARWQIDGRHKDRNHLENQEGNETKYLEFQKRFN